MNPLRRALLAPAMFLALMLLGACASMPGSAISPWDWKVVEPNIGPESFPRIW